MYRAKSIHCMYMKIGNNSLPIYDRAFQFI